MQHEGIACRPGATSSNVSAWLEPLLLAESLADSGKSDEAHTDKNHLIGLGHGSHAEGEISIASWVIATLPLTITPFIVSAAGVKAVLRSIGVPQCEWMNADALGV